MAVSAVVPNEDIPDQASSGIVPADDLPTNPLQAPRTPSDFSLQGISARLNALTGPALKTLGAQQGMQPFTSLSDALPIPTSATGNPAQDLYDSIKKVALFPSRLSSTLGALSGPASEWTAEKLGALGLEPHIAGALAMATGMAVDPRNIALAGVENPESPIIGNIGGATTEARAANAARYGIDLTPAEASQTRLLGYLEAIGNRYPYTADDFTNFYTNQLQQADNIRAHLINTLGRNEASNAVEDMMKSKIQNYLQGATPEQTAVLQDKFSDLEGYFKNPQTGQFAQSMLAQQRKIALDQAGKQFEDIQNVVPSQTPLKTPLFAEMAQKFLNQELDAKVPDRSAGWVKRLYSYTGSPEVPGMDIGEAATGGEASNLQKLIAEQMGQTEPQMTLGSSQMTMRKLRDLRISNDPGYLLGIKGQGNTYAGYAAKLRQALSQDIENGLNEIDPNAGQMFQQAKQNYAQTKELMNDPFIIKLLKNNPEDFLNHAVKPQDVTNVAKLKGILGDENFVPVQQNVLANLLVDKSGNLNPSSFINKVDRLGYPTLSTIFDPDTLSEIANSQAVFRSMTNLDKAVGQGSPTAGLLMAKGALWGIPMQAFHLIMNGNLPGAVGLVAGGIGLPKALAKMYLSPMTRDLLIHGIAAPDSATLALGVLGKAATMGANEAVSATAGASAPQQQPQGQGQ